MAESSTPALTFEEKHRFFLRKLHSLTGIVPVGVFLIEHMLTNSMAWYGGEETFNHHVKFLHSLPYLTFLEIFGIFLPLLFHAGYGIRIAMTAKMNSGQYPYMANRRFTLQRATGYIAFLFIIVHLLKFRFAHWFGGIPFLEDDIANKFEITRRGLMEWHIGSMAIPAAFTMTMYLIGLGAAVFHFANGIWTFCISWGITVGAKAQRNVGYLAASVGLLLFAWGASSLYAFANAPKKDLPPKWNDINNNNAIGSVNSDQADADENEHGSDHSGH